MPRINADLNARLTASRFPALLLTGLLFAALLRPLPAAEPAKPRAWKTIVIHHSATRVGSAATFESSHRARGMVNGLAYHFVIDNGSQGTEDGFIETGSRWIHQLQGGHCKQDDVNETGIGICLVGDFSRDEPTEKQMQSLILLIRGLQDQFQIDADNVIGHGDIFGEYSECPGHKFRWDQLRQQLHQRKSSK
jgi:N-acetyl-anhydromuramyl-L-alanine amidase AmpD